jgi:CBS domain-containing protein
MRVEKIMSHQATACSPEDTLEQAASLMWSSDCGALPVTSGDGLRRVVGIITDRDICMAALFQGKALRELRVGDVMSKNVFTCRPGDDLEKVEQKMQNEQIRRLPVVDDDGAVLGMVSMADLACEAARSQYSQRHEVPASEVMNTLAKISARPANQDGSRLQT